MEWLGWLLVVIALLMVVFILLIVGLVGRCFLQLCAPFLQHLEHVRKTLSIAAQIGAETFLEH